jgi:hypothetical protein
MTQRAEAAAFRPGKPASLAGGVLATNAAVIARQGVLRRGLDGS